MKKLYIKTFGCQMNEYDSGKMADLLHADEGMEMTNSPEDADVVLLNTCSIREKAEDKVFSDLGRLRELKKTKPIYLSELVAVLLAKKVNKSSVAHPMLMLFLVLKHYIV